MPSVKNNKLLTEPSSLNMVLHTLHYVQSDHDLGNSNDTDDEQEGET